MTTGLTITRTADNVRQGYDKVSLLLRQKLLDGSLQPGDILLPERELAEQLEVSRPIVREALRALAIIGVLEIRGRVGTFVRKPDVSILGDIFAFTLAQDRHAIGDLMQARIAIECQAVRLACEHVSPQSLEDASEALLAIERTIDSPDDGSLADYQFHSTLVRASGSDILISLYDAIRPLLLKLHRDRRNVLGISPELREHIIEDHRRIFDALASRNAEEADRRLRSHFKIGDQLRCHDLVRQARAV